MLVADASTTDRAGVKACLESNGNGLRVVGESADAVSARIRIRLLRPHVLVVDLLVPDDDGLTLAEIVRAEQPETRIVFHTLADSEKRVREMLDAGADAVVSKREPTDALTEAVTAVIHGRRYLDPELAIRLLAPERPPAALEQLSPREQDVVLLVARGRTNGEIAETLGLSPRTVETHRAGAMRRLGVRSRADLVAYAIDTGLLDAPNALARPPLTEREWGILRLVALGYSNDAIATRLALSSRTVEMHRASAMRSLGMRTRGELVEHALQFGLLRRWRLQES